MKAIQLNEPGTLTSILMPEPSAPAPGEALVRVHRIGVCATDIHAFNGKQFENTTTWRQAVAEHKVIITALASRDPESAKQAMQRHLRSSHNRLTKQIEDDLRKDF